MVPAMKYMQQPWSQATVIMTIAAILHAVLPLDTDIYWLCSVCRRLLSGAVLYRDIVETNPPMAVWLYLPAVAIEHVTGWAAESVFVALVLIAGAASALAFARLAGLSTGGRWLALVVVLLVPLSAFGEREHVALILMVPLLGLAMRRARGETVTLWLALVCGLLAGMAPMIKPHFALGLAGAYIAVAVLRRDWRQVLAPEIVVAGLLAAGYAVSVYVFMPAYAHDVVPLLLDVYRPMRKPLWSLLLSSQVLTWLMSVGALWYVLRRFEAGTTMLLAASFGFLIAFVDQGRGWAYHALPMVATLMLSVWPAAWPIVATGDERARMQAVVACFAAAVNIAGFSVFTFPAQGVVPVLQAIVEHPTVMGITADQAPGHPITTRVHGIWVGTYSSRWITANSRVLYGTAVADQARLVKWMVLDRNVTNADLAKRPDVVLIGLGPYDWTAWIAADPETTRLMSGYVLVATDALTPQRRKTYEGVEAWVRRDLLPAP